MLYAAIDIHKRMFQAAVLDVETGETVERSTRWPTPLVLWPTRGRTRSPGRR
jgi:hypothetical protein